jgi:hypothetical protein
VRVWVSRLVVAVAGFAVWTLFSMQLFTGRSGIHEAWDFPAYWKIGVPLLLLLVAGVGYLSEDAPRTLALWTLAGHFLGVVLIKQPTTDLGLLPLSLILLGLPGFAAFAGAAWFGQSLRPVGNS